VVKERVDKIREGRKRQVREVKGRRGERDCSQKCGLGLPEMWLPQALVADYVRGWGGQKTV